jgi:hypothetical protein
MRADWTVVEKTAGKVDQQGKRTSLNLLVLDPDFECRALRAPINSCRPLQFTRWSNKEETYVVRKQPVFTLF